MQIKRGRLSMVCVCVVLGFLLALQFRSTRDFNSNLPYQRTEELAARLQQMEKENEVLRQSLDELKEASGVEKYSKFSEDMKMISGQTAVEGQGIIITIEDSKQGSSSTNDPNLYLVHDEDLLKVINELRAAGAEAIAINGQRLTAMSEIRCAGPTLSVNNVRTAPPFEIRAIGNSKDLVAAINMRGGVADALKVWGIVIDVQQREKLYIPAYKSSNQFKYAAPTEKQEGE